MIKEIYTTRQQEHSVNIVNSDVNSYRKKDIKKTGIRVYNGGMIGISGFIGEEGKQKAEKQAVKALSNNVKYPCDPTSGIKRSESVGKDVINPKDLINEVQTVLDILKKDYPDFILSNKVKLHTMSSSLKNTADLDLEFISKFITWSFVFKDRDSANVFDGSISFYGDRYNREDFIKYASSIFSAYRNPVDVEEGDIPVLFMSEDGILYSKFANELSGRSFGSKASMFAGKLNERMFSEKFNLINNRNSNYTLSSFFDVEGTVLDNNEFVFIENGVLKAPYTNKKVANEYGLKLSANAMGAYDSVPGLSHGGMQIKDTGNTLKEILNGEKAILVQMAAGGDYTAEGGFGTPVQLSFLFDGEKIVGKLPPLQINSNIYDMYGKDLLGVSTDNINPLLKEGVCAMRMKVRKG